MGQHAVGHLAGHLGHPLAHRGEEDPRVAVGIRPRVEHRGHQRVAVELAAEGQPAAVGPAGPDGPDGQDEFPHPRGRMRPGHGEPLLDVGLDLGPEPEHEPALRQRLEVVGHHGQIHRDCGRRPRRSRCRARSARCARPPASGAGTGRGWSRPTRCRRSRPRSASRAESMTPLGSNPMPPSTSMGHGIPGIGTPDQGAGPPDRSCIMAARWPHNSPVTDEPDTGRRPGASRRQPRDRPAGDHADLVFGDVASLADSLLTAFDRSCASERSGAASGSPAAASGPDGAPPPASVRPQPWPTRRGHASASEVDHR